MVELNVFSNFLIAIALGAMVGFEREIAQLKSVAKELAGLRTFILISLLGAITGYLANVSNSNTLFIVALAGVFFITIAGYTVTSFIYKKVGATTEVAALLVFLFGAMTTTGFRELAIIFTIIVTVVLAIRPILAGFVKKVETAEIYATLELAVISLVILPFLANKSYSPLDIPILTDIIKVMPFFSIETVAQLAVFNPYKIWLMIVFISAISFTGYISIKIVGAEKGLGLTGFLGGLVSSTAVTTSLAQESKRTTAVFRPFVLGVVIASSTMFLRVMLEVLVVNSSLIKFVALPLGVMALTGFIAAFIVWNKEKKEHAKKIDFKSPFALLPAIKFGLFFAFVLFAAKLGQILYGSKGIYLASLLSGLVDVDAITLSMSSLALTGDISSKVAVTAITIAVSSNTIVKGGIAYLFGAREFGLMIIKIFGLILLLGLASTLLL